MPYRSHYIEFETKTDSFYLPKMTEIFTYPAYRQLCQMFVAIIFFHSSECILAIATHGTSNVTPKSLLISKKLYHGNALLTAGALHWNFFISWVEGTLVVKQLGPCSGYSWRNH